MFSHSVGCKVQVEIVDAVHDPVLCTTFIAESWQFMNGVFSPGDNLYPLLELTELPPTKKSLPLVGGLYLYGWFAGKLLVREYL